MDDDQPDIDISNIKHLDSFEYNRLLEYYENNDKIDKELEIVHNRIKHLATSIENEISEIDKLRPGAHHTKFELREHLLRNVDQEIKIITEKSKRRKDSAKTSGAFKKEILTRLKEADDSTITAEEAAAFVKHTRDVLSDIDVDVLDGVDINSELKKQEEENGIEFSDGEKIMMLAERDYEIVYATKDKKFKCIDKDTDDFIDIYPVGELPVLSKFTKESGELNVEDDQLVSLDGHESYRVC